MTDETPILYQIQHPGDFRATALFIRQVLPELEPYLLQVTIVGDSSCIVVFRAPPSLIETAKAEGRLV